jgi:hypothetical protein
MKHYSLVDRYSRQTIDYLQLIQVELPRAKHMLKERGKKHKRFSEAEWWVELLCYSSEYTDKYIAELKAAGVIIPSFFERALTRLDMNVWAPELQTEYETDLTDRANYSSVLAVERNEGKIEGKIEGLEEGGFNAKRRTALVMISENEDDKTILKYSGLTAEELVALKNSLPK